MAAGNLEPISLDDREVDYDDYVGVLEGGIVGRSERMLTAYTDLESRFRDRFEDEIAEQPNRFVESTDDTERFREELAETFESDLYPALSEAGEEDIGGYAAFQEAMRTLSELNYVKFLDRLETGRHAVSKTRNHSSNAASRLNEIGEILTEKGYNHSTKEPISERFSQAKRNLKRAARIRRKASVGVKQCYFYVFTGDLVREKYGLDATDYQYVDVEESLIERIERVREEFVRQDRQIRQGRRSLKHKLSYVKKNYDV